MPRKSVAALATSPVFPPLSPARVEPPPGLASDERELFLRVVMGARPEHFQAADVPLLAAYIRACVLEEISAVEIKRLMADAPKRLLDVHGRATKVMYQLSQRLRLNPLARQPHLSRQSDTKAPALSVYERLRMERGDGPLKTPRHGSGAGRVIIAGTRR